MGYHKVRFLMPIIFVLLVSCSARLTNTPTKTITTRPSATVRPSMTPTSTITATYTATETAYPTAISTSTVIYTPKPTRTSTPTITEIPCWIFDESNSPDYQWVAKSNICPGSSILNVSNVDGKYIWEYQSGTEYVLLISGWSKDGRYLYFDTSPSQGKWYFYEEAYSFSRMDLTNGEVEVLLNAEEDTNGFANPFNSISLSPDEKLIVYLAVSYQEKVVIRNLETGEEKQAHLDYADGGHFSWTSDSLKVAFVVCYNSPDYLYPIHEEVKLLDVETMSITTLLTADRGNVFHLGGWNEDNTILYLGINMVFDTKTGKLMTEIPISTPTREP